jgi:hypothetical protein
MDVPVSLWRKTCWRWVKLHPFTVLGGVGLLILAVFFCRRQDSEWEQVYVRAAAHLWQGMDLYGMRESYLYPPFMAVTALPFLVLASPLQRLLWFGINAVALVALLRWGWRLAGGGRLEGSQAGRTAERIAALLGCLCGISYIENCLAHQQTDLVIGAALVGGCLLLGYRRPMLAATSFGLAAACKCTALLWAPYLFWRGRTLAAIWVVVIAVGVNLLPDLIRPSPRGRPWIEQYAASFLMPLTASDHYIGTWGSDPVYNQSVTGLAQRWCTTTWTWTAADCTIETRTPRLQPGTLRFCVYGVQLSLLAAVLCICGRPLRKLTNDSEEWGQPLESCMVLLLMLLLSPMSSKAHFGTLVVPGYCLARAALHARSRLFNGILAAAVVLGLLCNKDPLGERLYTLSLWYGLVTWQTLLLLGGCLLIYRQQRSAGENLLPCPTLVSRSVQQAA